ncbi:MAG: YigZ family protein [Flavobacteriaceae bacterium]|nr:YigZ family protein [Flavobacteriaceae bacterium]
MKNTYRTIDIKSECLLKEKQSKFYGYAFPISDIESVKSSIDSLKKMHHSARHFCYAYQIGVQDLVYRVNDDGEPRNSAGIPIYGQIQSFDLTNILIVVVRYFGGTKLGVGGLVSAYKECAKLTIESNTIITKEITIKIQLKFDYLLMNKVMRVIKEHNLEILKQQMHTSCVFELLTTTKNNDIVCDQFNRHLGIVISIK